MDELTLTVETGRQAGSSHARRLRAAGRVPGVVYGLDSDTLPVSVAWPELRRALTTEAGVNALLTLEIDGTSQLSIVKELQRDPVGHGVKHVDFIRIDREAEVEVEVPIVLEGHAEAVERDDGTVAHLLFALTVKARPDAIPPHLTLNVSNMEVGDSIRVADLVLPEGVTTEIDLDEVVVTAQISRSTIEVAAEEEAAELAALEALEALGDEEGLDEDGAREGEATDAAADDAASEDDDG